MNEVAHAALIRSDRDGFHKRGRSEATGAAEIACRDGGGLSRAINDCVGGIPATNASGGFVGNNFRPAGCANWSKRELRKEISAKRT
jgi:hypothetical protein